MKERCDMKDTKFRILLDIHEVRSQATIPVKVGDVSCKIYITLVEGGKPYKIHENSFGVFTGKKGDDKYLFNNCVIENGIIRYDFTPQTVAAAGVLECEIRIYDEDGGVLTTPSFNIVVDERAVNDSELASTTEFTFLDEIIVNEGQRMENERNRIEAFNNMGLSVDDKGDYYILTKTNKDGSKEEFPIGKGEDYVITPEDYKAIADKVVTDTLDAQAAEYFDNLDAQATEHLENIDKKIDGIIDGKVSVVETATGSAITIESSQAPLQNLKLYGKTEQDGTPTPTEPKELKSVGDSGSFEFGVYGKNLLENTLTTQTNNGVTYTVNSDKSVKISGENTGVGNEYVLIGYLKKVRSGMVFNGISGGNMNSYYITLYDEINAQRISWVTTGEYRFTKDYSKVGVYAYVVSGATVNCTLKPMISIDGGDYEPYKAKQTLTITDTMCNLNGKTDERDYTKGTKTQRTLKFVANGSENWNYNVESKAYQIVVSNQMVKRDVGISSHFQKGLNKDLCFFTSGRAYNNWLSIYDLNGKWSSLDDFKSWLSTNNVTFILELETPIETPLNETELNAYRQLMTNSGNTTILSEAEMEVDYYINKPNAQAIGNIHSQINKDYFKLQQAIISTGGN